MPRSRHASLAASHLTLLAALALPAAAQSAPAPADTLADILADAPADTAPGAAPTARTDPLCWRGRPLPRCRAYVLFELGYHARVGGTGAVVRRPSDGLRDGIGTVGSHLSWSLGAMQNRDSLTAVGGALLLGIGDPGKLLGAQLRYRRWMGRASSAELGAGPLGMRVPRTTYRPGTELPVYDEPLRVGAVVDARLNYADRIAGGARVILVPDGRRLRGVVLAGGNVGSGLAVAGTVGLATLVALAIAALARGDF